jgi:hypothetical protein
MGAAETVARRAEIAIIALKEDMVSIWSRLVVIEMRKAGEMQEIFED